MTLKFLALLTLASLSGAIKEEPQKMKPEEIRALFQKLKQIGDTELMREKTELEKEKASHTASENDLAFLATLT